MCTLTSQVLVRLGAAGVNYIDTYHRTGLYKLDLPTVIGREGAGTIEKLGQGVTNWKVGDRVAFLAPGSYAQYNVVSAQKCVAIPDELDFTVAAAIMLQGLTAHYLITSTYPVKNGDTVLIHAGAGGTGGLMIQMAKLKGARVITTVSTAEKAEIAKGLGADEVINYSEQDFLAEVKTLTDGKGVDAVYDGVGKATWESSMKSLRPRGFLVLFGNASGPVPPVDPLLLTQNGSIFMTRPTLLNHVATTEEFTSRCKDIFEWISSSSLKVRVSKTFPLAEAKDAHIFLTSRQALGKVVLLP